MRFPLTADDSGTLIFDKNNEDIMDLAEWSSEEDIREIVRRANAFDELLDCLAYYVREGYPNDGPARELYTKYAVPGTEDEAPELDAEFFKNATLTKPGEKLPGTEDKA